MVSLDMFKRRDNVSTVMLMPVLRINKRLINEFYNQGFVNTYLFCDELDEDYTFPKLYIVFEPVEFDNVFRRFSTELQSQPGYIDTVDWYSESVIFVFKIPDQFEADFKLFLKGKYSKVSEIYKKCFQLEKPAKNENGTIKKDIQGGIIMEPTNFYHIFNKTEKLRKMYKESLDLDFDLPPNLELYDIVNREKETLTSTTLNQ